MSSRELERAEVMGRVGSGDLKLSDAAVMLELSYRQIKRLWRRDRQVGRKRVKKRKGEGPSERRKTLKKRPPGFNFVMKKKFGFGGGRIWAKIGGRDISGK